MGVLKCGLNAFFTRSKCTEMCTVPIRSSTDLAGVAYSVSEFLPMAFVPRCSLVPPTTLPSQVFRKPRSQIVGLQNFEAVCTFRLDASVSECPASTFEAGGPRRWHQLNMALLPIIFRAIITPKLTLSFS